MNFQMVRGQAAALFGASLLVLLLAFLPLVYCAALVITILGTGVVILCLSLIKDMRQRHNAVQLFLLALVVRLTFTVILYESGLVYILGGADDTGWETHWRISQRWQGLNADAWMYADPVEQARYGQHRFPSSIISLYDGSTVPNRGFGFFVACFYYLLGIPSQVALAAANNIISAITVVVIYRIAISQGISEKTGRLAAIAAIFMPSLLLWSSLTVKESWLIFFEIYGFYNVLIFAKEQSIKHAVLALLMLLLAFTMRFYVAWIMAAAAIAVYIYQRSRQPKWAILPALLCTGVLLCAALTFSSDSQDFSDATHSYVQSATAFRFNVSDSDSVYGTKSGVALDYDLSTPKGVCQQLITGSVYLLLAPFPWQVLDGRQLFVIPDIIVWWVCAFVFVIPGLIYLWRNNIRLLLSIGTYIIPLLLVYALHFGNIGLAQRQRSQMLPFFLLCAAAGAEGNREKRAGRLANKLRGKAAPLSPNIMQQ